MKLGKQYKSKMRSLTKRKHFLKRQTESLELKYTMTSLKNSIENIVSRLNHVEERISEHKDRTFELSS